MFYLIPYPNRVTKCKTVASAVPISKIYSATIRDLFPSSVLLASQVWIENAFWIPAIVDICRVGDRSTSLLVTRYRIFM